MNLSNITLISITNQDKYLDTVKAIDFTCKSLDFADVKIISNIKINDKYEHIHNNAVNTLVGYNEICINGLYDIVKTDFCLIVQWDGFVINPQLWKNEFLNYDYIGAPWDHAVSKNRIGNGGFSLRSKKFLEVSKSLKYEPHNCEWLYDWQANYRDVAPEDWFICYNNYEYVVEQGVKFPNVKLASDFAIEYPVPCHRFDKSDISTYKSFGFHGNFNTGAMSLL
jgi:hypothetical protein